MVSRLAASGLLVAALALPAGAGDQVYLSAEEAPAAVLPDAERFETRTIESTPELREQVSQALGRTKPTVWESSYRIARGFDGDRAVGDAIVVEEVGKHRAITFVVGVDSDGEVVDVAVMAYREPYGGEVRSRRFLRQYRGKDGSEPLQPGRDIRNISGATLSARAIGRGVKKAVAVLSHLDLAPPHEEIASTQSP